MNLILFDVSGTLVHPSEKEEGVMKEVLTEMLGTHVSDSIAWNSRESESEFVQKAWREVRGSIPTQSDWIQIFEKHRSVLQSHYQNSKQRFKAVEGATELLNSYSHSSSWRFVISTTSWKDLAHLSLRSSGFYTRRMHIVTGEDVFSKIDLINKSVQSAKAWYKVDRFEKVTYVGDTFSNINACCELNMPFLDVSSLKPTHKAAIHEYPEKHTFVNMAKKAVVPRKSNLKSLISLTD